MQALSIVSELKHDVLHPDTAAAGPGQLHGLPQQVKQLLAHHMFNEAGGRVQARARITENIHHVLNLAHVAGPPLARRRWNGSWGGSRLG
jgi:hypothetical protein